MTTQTTSTTKRKVTRATSPEDHYLRTLAVSSPVSDDAYLHDEAILAAALQQFPLEEVLKMNPHEIASIAVSCGSPHFDFEMLPLACKAQARREAELNKLLDYLLPRLLDTTTVDDVAFADERIRGRVRDAYKGPINFDELLTFVGGELEFIIGAERLIQDVERAEHKRFLDIYSSTRPYAFAGAWSILKDCGDLGSSEEEAREIVQQTYAVILDHISEWMEDGPASLPTRVYAAAQWQARAWKIARLRKRVPGLDAVADDPEAVSLSELWNPVQIVDHPFTEDQLFTELHEAGPFRA